MMPLIHIRQPLPWLAIACVLAACNPTQPAAGGARPETAGGGEQDFRPRAVILSPTHGASGVAPRIRIEVVISCPRSGPCTDDPDRTTATIARKLRIIDAAGRVTPVSPEPIAKAPPSPKGGIVPTLPANEYMRAFVADWSVALDQAYTLEIRSDWEAVVGFLDASTTEQTAALNSRGTAVTHTISMFTGSAPAVTRIDVANDPNKPVTSVRVRFSEPVRMASLVGNIALTAKDGRVLAGCPWSAHRRACATGASTELSELVDIVFPSGVPSSVITSSTLSVSTSVQGAVRTIGEAARIKGLAGPTDAAVVALEDAAWEKCSAEGDVLCVRSSSR